MPIFGFFRYIPQQDCIAFRINYPDKEDDFIGSEPCNGESPHALVEILKYRFVCQASSQQDMQLWDKKDTPHKEKNSHAQVT